MNYMETCSEKLMSFSKLPSESSCNLNAVLIKRRIVTKLLRWSSNTVMPWDKLRTFTPHFLIRILVTARASLRDILCMAGKIRIHAQCQCFGPMGRFHCKTVVFSEPTAIILHVILLYATTEPTRFTHHSKVMRKTKQPFSSDKRIRELPYLTISFPKTQPVQSMLV